MTHHSGIVADSISSKMARTLLSALLFSAAYASPTPFWSNANSSTPPRLFFTTTQRTNGSTSDSMIHTGIVSGSTMVLTNFSVPSTIEAIAVDAKSQSVYTKEGYFNDSYYQHSLFRWSYDGRVQSLVLAVAPDRYGNLQVATVANQTQLYFIDGNWDSGIDAFYYGDTQPTKVRRVNLDGSGVKTLLYPESMTCRPIPGWRTCEDFRYVQKLAIDEAMGYIYFTVAFGSGALWRMPIERRANETLANRSDIELLLHSSSDIVDIKFADGVLYWIENPYRYRVIQDQVWKWPATYGGNKLTPETMTGKVMLGETMTPYNETTTVGLRGLGIDKANRELWALHYGDIFYTVGMDGGNLTRLNLSLGLPPDRAIERFVVV